MGRRLRLPTGRSVAALFDEHGAFVWRTLRHLGVEDAGLDDAVQDVFVTAFRRQTDFEGRSTERTWLFGIARRIAFRYRRAARTRQRVLAPAGAKPPEGSVEPHRRADARHSIARLVGGLDRDKRTVFVLCELEGMTAAEVAEVLTIPIGTVHSRRRAAWQRLAAAAEQDVRQLRAAVAELGPETPDEQRTDRIRALLIATLGATTAKTITVVAVAAAVVIGMVTVAVTRPSVDAAPHALPDRVVARTIDSASRPGNRAVPSSAPAAMAPAPVVGPSAVPVASPPEDAKRPARNEPDPGADALTAELRLLQTARASFEANQWKAAVDALDRHERRFARGQLAAERDALLVRALCALGSDDRAQRIAKRRDPSAQDPCSG